MAKKNRQRKKPQRAVPRPAAATAGHVEADAGIPEAVASMVTAGQSVKDRPEFWNGVLRAAGAEPRAAREVGGASGVRHPALAVGVDDTEKRLILVSSEADARGAALAQADIQSAMSDYRVIVARPLIVSATQAASALAQTIGSPRLSIADLGLDRFENATEEEKQAIVQGHLKGVFEVVDQWIRNARSVKSVPFMQVLKQLMDQFAPIRFENSDEDFAIDLTGLTSASVSLDSQLGICGFPLYQMSDDDLDAFSNHGDPEIARDVLRRHEVLQFFFPAPDQLLLGAIDRGAAIASAEEPASLARKLGHPTGQMELVPSDTALPDLIDALRDRKLLVAGEVSVELSAEGAKQRASVKFSPREGIVSKIINRISVNIDLRQIIGLNIGGRTSKDDGVNAEDT